jgi:hypothetical protein
MSCKKSIAALDEIFYPIRFILQSCKPSAIHVYTFDFIQQENKVHGEQAGTPAGRQETNVSRPSQRGLIPNVKRGRHFVE